MPHLCLYRLICLQKKTESPTSDNNMEPVTRTHELKTTFLQTILIKGTEAGTHLKILLKKREGSSLEGLAVKQTDHLDMPEDA